MKNNKITWKFPSIGSASEEWWRDLMAFTTLIGGITYYSGFVASKFAEADLMLPALFKMVGLMSIALVLSIVYWICLRYKQKNPTKFEKVTSVGLVVYPVIMFILTMIDGGLILTPFMYFGMTFSYPILILSKIGQFSPVILPLLGIRIQKDNSNKAEEISIEK